MSDDADAADLLVIGAGHLGQRVVAAWLAQNPTPRVTAETAGRHRHQSLRRLGARVRQRTDAEPAAANNVLFAVPPSAVADYEAEAARATRLHAGAGQLLMASSTATYAEGKGHWCDESAATGDNERAQRLLAAEAKIRGAGGMVVRLAGLYDHSRGPHRAYLARTTSPKRPDGWINLIHYDDAATLCLQALRHGRAGAVYMGCDSTPLTRAELSALAAEHLAGDGAEGCRFVGQDGPVGRRCDNRATRGQLDWEPQYPSFKDWAARVATSGSG